MKDAMRREWAINGMDCAACTRKVTQAVERLPGVSDVKVALMSERLSLMLEPGTTDPFRVEETVRRLGYGISPREKRTAEHRAGTPFPDAHGADSPNGLAGSGDDHSHHAGAGNTPSHPEPARTGEDWYRTGKGRLVVFVGSLLALAWAVELVTPARYGYWAFVGASLIGVAPVTKRAVEALRMGQPFTIESLMTIAAIGALFIGAAEEAALVVFLFAVGELLEGVAAGKARDGIRALANLVPRTAFLEEAGMTREVPADSLTVSQRILVRPGDRIPADGEIVEGTGGVDESPVTGESVPVTRGPGDPVFAGSVNTESVLRIRVTRTASDNTIARIIRLVEEAEESRAPTERFIDRFSRWYMPAIVGMAALVVLLPPLFFGQDWGTWIYRGLALLLIGCPCALVISVPASIASSLSSGARRGLLMKGGAVIEAAAKITRVAFDKTGTVTNGRPKVTDILTAAEVTQGELLAVAAGVEVGSSHPLALAILRHADEAGIEALPATGARAIPGQGAEAQVGDALAWVSSPRRASETDGIAADHVRLAAEMESRGKTVVAVYREGCPLGLIAMRDEPRKDAAEAMRQLGSMGISPVILTGDNHRTAQAIADGLGMDYRAEMMPEDKLTVIREMSAGGGVMMIGDGINDAPALKQADIGVAMGSGTDVALEIADAAVLRNRVTDVPALIRMARATMENIRQNIFIALGLKAVFLVTSVLGVTGLWIAILADTGATVLVTMNALRLLRFDPVREG